MEGIQKEVQRVLEKAPGLGIPQPYTIATNKAGSSSRPSKTSNTKETVIDALDELIRSLEEAKQSTLPNSILANQLEKKVAKCSKTINDKHKEYYNSLTRLSKSLDKKFTISIDGVADYSLFQSEAAQTSLNRVVRDHLMRSGEWEAAKRFEAESKLPQTPPSYIGDFQALHSTLTDIRSGHLSTAIDWTERESAFLEARSSQLEFALHRSRFLRIALGKERTSDQGEMDEDDDMEGEASNDQFMEAKEHHDTQSDPDGEAMEDEEYIQRDASPSTKFARKRLNADGDLPTTSRAEAALLYGRQHLRPTQPMHLEEIKRLFTFLLFLPDSHVHGGAETPFDKESLLLRIPSAYHYFLDEDQMHGPTLAPLFQREYTARQGVAREAPLKVAVEVGAGGALNIIIKVRSLMKEKGNEWSQADELPVEIPLPAHLRFHSTFACPVSKEQGTEGNPPTMLNCGHVLCLETIARLGKGSGRVKCPYCPIESTISQATRVYF
ncbi:hypothetical protein CBS101457_001116 [Exobasidium rhododendri]|nr:hypothetical protein CBS101457_001116 [Exobasidium rhododendri]